MGSLLAVGGSRATARASLKRRLTGLRAARNRERGSIRSVPGQAAGRSPECAARAEPYASTLRSRAAACCGRYAPRPPSATFSATVIAGTSVLQRLGGCQDGATYHLRAVATSNTGTVHVVAASIKAVTL